MKEENKTLVVRHKEGIFVVTSYDNKVRFQ